MRGSLLAFCSLIIMANCQPHLPLGKGRLPASEYPEADQASTSLTGFLNMQERPQTGSNKAKKDSLKIDSQWDLMAPTNPDSEISPDASPKLAPQRGFAE